jgi:hypothetical protein
MQFVFLPQKNEAIQKRSFFCQSSVTVGARENKGMGAGKRGIIKFRFST